MAHGLKCYHCGESATSNTHYLCFECLKKLEIMLVDGKIIENPSFIHHCVVCGEYENRKIIDSMIPICDKCVVEELLEYE